MATRRPGTPSEQRTDRPIDGTLQPFPGYFVPGVCFRTGHCFWLLEFTSSPTEFDSYTELWLITPDGERVLYTDPEEATQEVLQYHDFDRTAGANVSVERPDSESVVVSLEGNDGTELDLELSLGQTLGTRILNTVISLTPQPLLRSRFGAAVSTFSLNLLLDGNGMKVAGRTETGRRYRLDAERLLSVTDASATLNATDLGAHRAPTQPIEFGDAKTTADAVYIPGELYLERLNQ